MDFQRNFFIFIRLCYRHDDENENLIKQLIIFPVGVVCELHKMILKFCLENMTGN